MAMPRRARPRRCWNRAGAESLRWRSVKALGPQFTTGCRMRGGDLRRHMLLQQGVEEHGPDQARSSLSLTLAERCRSRRPRSAPSPDCSCSRRRPRSSRQRLGALRALGGSRGCLVDKAREVRRQVSPVQARRRDRSDRRSHPRSDVDASADGAADTVAKQDERPAPMIAKQHGHGGRADEKGLAPNGAPQLPATPPRPRYASVARLAHGLDEYVVERGQGALEAVKANAAAARALAGQISGVAPAASTA